MIDKPITTKLNYNSSIMNNTKSTGRKVIDSTTVIGNENINNESNLRTTINTGDEFECYCKILFVI